MVVRKLSSRGGNEKKALEVAVGLGRRGHRVLLLCQKVDAAASPDGTELRILSGLSCDPSLAALTFARASARTLNELRRSNAIDVALGFNDCFGTDVFRLGAGVHAAFLERRTRTKPVLDRVALSLERRRFGPKGFRRLIVPARAVGEEVRVHYPVEESRIDVVPNGVDLEAFVGAEKARDQLRASWNLKSKAAVFVANELERKGFAIALKATEQAGLHLLVAGRARRPQGLPDHVVWLGERRDLPQVLAASDVLVLPSRYEPIGNVVLEAWAAGLPAVFSRCVGAAELAEGTPAADFVVEDPDDVPAFAQALKRAVAQPFADEAQALAARHSLGPFVARVESVLVRARSTPWR